MLPANLVVTLVATSVDTLARALADRYELTREVGRGGMARVFLASDRRHEREVAIKVLLPELAATLGAERFLREIRLVARLQHPHILPLFDSGEAAGLLYFVMPFVAGESLRARLDRDGALAPAEATRLVRQLADALDYAHARGVIHRDLKPENVLLTEGQALLADFGVARGPTRDTADGATLTEIGVTLGTPAYMSPEQAAGERALDARSDVYALGCLCYELLAGRPPFRGASAMALIGQHLASPPPPLEGARGPLPPDVAAAVARALAKDPDARFASAGAFATALEAGLAAARPPSTADVRLEQVERRQESSQRVLVLDFANLTRAADVDWLGTGIVETVSADLAKIAGVRVVGQDAATRRRIEAAMEGRPLDAALAVEIGRSSGAHWVVWGAFQKFGTRIRITPHFVDTADGTRLGGEKIDGAMDEIFGLQDRIVTGLADALRIPLTSGDVARIERPETRHLGAYEHYARGYRAYLRFGKESVRTAAEHFRAAIAMDPGYAMAHAGLGIIHGPMYIASGRREVLDEGARLLERALTLDPTIGEGYAWLAYMQFRQNRFDDAVRTARHGVEREPASCLSWYMLGCSHLCRAVVAHEPARMALSVPPFLRAAALDPGHLPSWMVLGAVYLLRGQYAHAAPAVERAVALETRGSTLAFLGAFVQRAVLHLGTGHPGAAAPLLERAIASYTGADHVYAELMTAYAHGVRGYLRERTGDVEGARADFERACDVADANEHRIAIGAHWVKGRFGLARVLHRLGDAAGAKAALTAGRALLASRARFVWTWIHGATDAEMLYDLAATLATLGRPEEALEALARAAGAGWSDVAWLRHDPAFTTLRDAPDMRRLCAGAATRVELPPPVGSGGLA
ncbi:MAG TPA: protein kinase [Gemmatirosa sp.]|nr:protein kinase [Gemmatirosa sp.]